MQQPFQSFRLEPLHPLFGARVAGLDLAQPLADAVLDELLDWCTRDGCVYTHRWAAGDLVMWDNRCTLHRGRPWGAASERRVMHRTTVIDRGYDAEVGARAA